MITSQERLALLQRHYERIQTRLFLLDGKNSRIRRWQVFCLFAAILLAITAFSIAKWVAFIVVAIGIGAIWFGEYHHKKITESFLKFQMLQRVVEVQIARIRLDWSAIPVPLLEGDKQEHPFEHDLDITGERSLFHLLNTAVSFPGMQRLHEWLLTRRPDRETILRRQALIQEIASKTCFRDKLFLYSLLASRPPIGPVDTEQLVKWLEQQRERDVKQRLSTLIIAIVLCAYIYLSVLLFIYLSFSPLFFVSSIILSLIWFLTNKKEQGTLAEDANYLSITTGQLRVIFEHLERSSYPKGSRLKILCEPFYGHDDRNPSHILKKLEKISRRARLAQQAEGWLFLNTLIPIGAYTAYQFDQIKTHLLHYLPIWLETWYELEALCSLANFAYLNPEYVMPKILPAQKTIDTTSLFEARQLGHPLLEKDQKVTNDVSMPRLGEMMLITGSNMAGKSTFLRTIGINLCLAYAGSVVNASFMSTALFEIYCCIRVTDSLADGYSYFYAEVRRLKQVLVEIEQNGKKQENLTLPLVFFIDEIFKGTNNYERLIGSEAYIRALVGKRCLGAISTHDLELVKLTDTFPTIHNMHFREDIVDGHMAFDYRLRTGPSPTRNALRIMHMEGLPVPWEESPPLCQNRPETKG